MSDTFATTAAYGLHAIPISTEGVVMAKNQTNTLTLENPVSPYGLAKFINENTDLDIQPQRMYQYARSGKLVIVENELGRKVVTVENGNAFLEWFLDPERGKRSSETEDEQTEEAQAS